MDDANANKIKGRISGKEEMAKFVAGGDANLSDKYKLNVLTKTCFDIMYTTTTTMDDAIDILLGNDYDGAAVGGKKAVLDMQFVALQNATMNTTPAEQYRADAGGGKYNNAKKANEAYDEGVNFLTYFDVDYSGKNKDDDATELNTAKTELQKYKSAGSSEPNKRKIYEF